MFQKWKAEIMLDKLLRFTGAPTLSDLVFMILCIVGLAAFFSWISSILFLAMVIIELLRWNRPKI